MTEADMQASEGQGVPPAGPQEQPQIQVPKYRLDEVSAQLRAAREEMALKDQLLQNLSNARQGQGQASDAESDEQDAQELGLDPQAYKAIKKLANKVADKKLQAQGQQFKAQVAHMSNSLEETQFLLNQGKDMSKYLGKIREMRGLHYQRTGGYLDMDMAFKMLRYDEMMSRQGQQVQVTQGQPPAAQANQAAPAYGYPNPEHTRAQAPATPPASKSFSEMSIEEQEAALDEEARRHGPF